MTVHPNIVTACMNVMIVSYLIELSHNLDRRTCWCFTDLHDVVMELDFFNVDDAGCLCGTTPGRSAIRCPRLHATTKAYHRLTSI